MTNPETKRPAPVTALAIIYFVSAAAIVFFLLANFILSFPLRSATVLILLVPFQCILGRGLWRLQNWARIVTAILSVFFAFPSIIAIVIAFRSIDLLKLLLNLSFVTFQGMVVGYLLHPESRRIFEQRRLTTLDIL